jgi:hypothetical protein
MSLLKALGERRHVYAETLGGGFFAIGGSWSRPVFKVANLRQLAQGFARCEPPIRQRHTTHAAFRRAFLLRSQTVISKLPFVARGLKYGYFNQIAPPRQRRNSASTAHE